MKKYGIHPIKHNGIIRGFCHADAAKDTDKLLKQFPTLKRLKSSSNPIKTKPVFHDEPVKPIDMNPDKLIQIKLGKLLELMEN